jgi:hypothetical protein
VLFGLVYSFGERLESLRAEQEMTHGAEGLERLHPRRLVGRQTREVVVLRVDLLMKLARFTERLQVDDVASLRVTKPADDALRDRSH